MTTWLTAEEQRAWRSLLAMNAELTARLNRGLQERGLSLADYDVLVALTDVRERSLRLRELGTVLQWEKSRVSRQVTRMAARGLVARRECPEDKRGAYVDLTEAGRQAIEAAAPGHVSLVRELVFDTLRADQVRALADACQAVLTSFTAGSPGPASGQ